MILLEVLEYIVLKSREKTANNEFKKKEVKRNKQAM